MSYMRKGFLIYEEMRKYLVIYEEAVKSYMTLQPLPSGFPYIGGFFFSLFYQRGNNYLFDHFLFSFLLVKYIHALYASNVKIKNVWYILILIVILIAHPLAVRLCSFQTQCPQYGSPQLTRRCFLLQLTPQVREQGRLW
jgi:hypothetical protein